MLVGSAPDRQDVKGFKTAGLSPKMLEGLSLASVPLPEENPSAT
jgi:hypothetical protein